MSKFSFSLLKSDPCIFVPDRTSRGNPIAGAFGFADPRAIAIPYRVQTSLAAGLIQPCSRDGDGRKTGVLAWLRSLPEAWTVHILRPVAPSARCLELPMASFWVGVIQFWTADLNVRWPRSIRAGVRANTVNTASSRCKPLGRGFGHVWKVFLH